MLFALGDPVSLLVLLASFAVAVTLAGWVSSLAAARAGSREVAAEGRLRPDPRRHLDPFGTIAALLSGIGWARPVPAPYRTGRGALLAITLSGPLLLLLIGVVSLVAVGLTGRSVVGAGVEVLQSGVSSSVPLGTRVLLLFGLVHLFVGLLSLVPLPPLDAGRLLFGLAPRTAGWQKAELYLVEKNLGTLAVLVLVLLPLGAALPLLPTLLSTVAEPVVAALTGA